MAVGDMELGLGFLYYLHIPVWYTHGLTCDHIFHPVVDGEKTGGEPHVFALIVSNVATI